jgi:hypothetical protein
MQQPHTFIRNNSLKIEKMASFSAKFAEQPHLKRAPS